MQVRCKFVCSSVTEYASKSKDFVFHPVTGGSEENKSFWKYTPSGEFKFSCLNENVNFEVGKEYYFDISPAE
jgi:hypothetical protein